MSDGRPFDPLDGLVAARDAIRKLQELATRVTLPAEHRAALTDGLSRLLLPGEQLQALVDLAEAFGPPQTQIEEIRKTIQAQREQLEKMAVDLERIEAGVDRLAAASEQLATLQRPFLSAMQRLGDVTGTKPNETPAASDADPSDA